jgi:hypothetical protein
VDQATRTSRGDERVGAAVRATVRIVGVLALAAVTWLARDVLLLAFFAVVLAVVMSFPVGWLSRVMPRGAGVLAVLLLGLGFMAGVGAVAAPTLSAQVASLRERAPRAIEQARRRLQPLLQGGGGGDARAGAAPSGGAREPGGGDRSGGGERGGGGGVAAQAAAKVAPAALWVVGGVTELVLLVVLEPHRRDELTPPRAG